MYGIDGEGLMVEIPSAPPEPSDLRPVTQTCRERHERGAHYTHEADIRRAIEPVLMRPFESAILRATTADDLLVAHDRIASVRILDPACGPGHFLRTTLAELLAIERRLLAIFRHRHGGSLVPRVGPGQLHGIDLDPNAVIAARENLGLSGEAAAQIRCEDALFCAWPEVDVIVGNPPFMAKNKLQDELGACYARRLRMRYPDVAGRADYCVYWFRRAHDELAPGGRGALVGTNTIRQNDSRRGGLDYIVDHGGTILEAVASQVWPGDAAVHVSIVSWVKGPAPGKKRILTQLGHRADGPFQIQEVPHIHAGLSADVDVTRAVPLSANRARPVCFQGLTPGHRAFLLDPDLARATITRNPESAAVLSPLLTGQDLLGREGGSPSRYVIDFGPLDLAGARRHGELFARLEREVLPARREAAQREWTRNADVVFEGPRGRLNAHHRAFLERYWQLAYGRSDLKAALAAIPRYVACSRIGRRPILAFVDSRVMPSDALTAFALADDYSFGVLQSDVHGAWLRARGSTMKGDFRYTSLTVFDSFPWPTSPSGEAVLRVAEAAVALRQERARAHAPSLRALYASMAPGSALHRAHAALDGSVRAAFGMPDVADALSFLLAQNQELAAREAAFASVPAPGLPEGVSLPETTDCIAFPIPR